MKRDLVLLLEDWGPHAEVEAEILSDEGFEVHTAVGVAEARELLGRLLEEPSAGQRLLLVVDSRIDGDDTAGARLVEGLMADRGGASPPWLFATNVDIGTLRDVLPDLPDARFLHKPFSRYQLIEAVQGLLDPSPEAADPDAGSRTEPTTGGSP